jgi:hypothetical protein
MLRAVRSPPSWFDIENTAPPIYKLASLLGGSPLRACSMKYSSLFLAGYAVYTYERYWSTTTVR